MTTKYSVSLKEFAKKPEQLAGGHRLCAGCMHSVVVRQDYGRQLRAEVKRIVNHPDAVDGELRHLRAALED